MFLLQLSIKYLVQMQLAYDHHNHKTVAMFHRLKLYSHKFLDNSETIDLQIFIAFVRTAMPAIFFYFLLNSRAKLKLYRLNIDFKVYHSVL